jgi:hypothetical protein
MELRTYAQLKAEGRANLVRIDDKSFQIELKRYDPETGAETTPEIVPLTLTGLEHAITQHQNDIVAHQQAITVDIPAEITGINGLIAEMQDLNSKA